MGVTATALLLAVTLAAAVFCGWRGARPPDFKRGPRLIPWRPLMVAFATASLLLLVHLANLFGVKTGR